MDAYQREIYHLANLPMTITELAKITDRSETSVRETVAALHRRGVVLTRSDEVVAGAALHDRTGWA